MFYFSIFFYFRHDGIFFFDAEKLTQVYHHEWQSARICKASPSMLMYAYSVEKPVHIHWLDCSTLPPTLAANGSAIHTKLMASNSILDMCCVQNGNRHLLIILTRYSSIHVYDIDANRWMWKWSLDRDSMIQAALTDGQSRVFLVSCNSIHELNVDISGKRLHTVVKREEYHWDKLFNIQWCLESLFLITHLKGGTRHIRFIDFKK